MNIQKRIKNINFEFGEYGPEDWSHWVDWEWLDLHQ